VRGLKGVLVVRKVVDGDGPVPVSVGQNFHVRIVHILSLDTRTASTVVIIVI
jgi:hypothetical protein